MTSNEIFFNSIERLRSGWRVAIFAIFYFILTASLIMAAISILRRFDFSENPLAIRTISFSLTSLTAIFAGWLCGKLFEGLPFRALGCWFTKNWLKDLVLGLLLGAIAILFNVLIAFGTGGIRFEINETATGDSIVYSLAATLVVFVAAAIFEEVFFRGYILQTLFRANYFLPGMLFTSMLFAMAHAGNPDSTSLALFNTFLAGVWFAAAYYKVRNLWLPFGLHLMWNWLQGSFLGINVSGLKELSSASILKAADMGPAWLTGGNYGIEGGIACTFTLLLAILLTFTAPFLKPSEDLLALTSYEIPPTTKPSES